MPTSVSCQWVLAGAIVRKTKKIRVPYKFPNLLSKIVREDESTLPRTTEQAEGWEQHDPMESINVVP